MLLVAYIGMSTVLRLVLQLCIIYFSIRWSNSVFEFIGLFIFTSYRKAFEESCVYTDFKLPFHCKPKQKTEIENQKFFLTFHLLCSYSAAPGKLYWISKFLISVFSFANCRKWERRREILSLHFIASLI